MRIRNGHAPKRRIAPLERASPAIRDAMALRLVYIGSAHHKTKPGDYGFQPPVNPRPWKSICDGQRIILLPEARALFKSGIRLGMFSDFAEGGSPKYVWCVDQQGEAYEAKVSPGTDLYKGYRLEEEDGMRAYVVETWKRRC